MSDPTNGMVRRLPALGIGRRRWNEGDIPLVARLVSHNPTYGRQCGTGQQIRQWTAYHGQLPGADFRFGQHACAGRSIAYSSGDVPL